jgi:ABC-type nitrate/sulfonate/bicarbonate transport system substrate-binding protein
LPGRIWFGSRTLQYPNHDSEGLNMYRMMVADYDSPSYFVATAAVKLGFFKKEGVDVEFIAEYGAKHGPERLRDGTIHFFGGPAFAATRAFPAWKGVRLVAALAQHSYWFMGIRKDIDIRRGDIKALKGLRISSSFAFPRTALRHMLIQAGIDVDQDEVRIVESLPSKTESHSLDGVKALQENLADGFWGNGMRLALAEKAGIAKLHLDLRRGDGPPDARHYNFAALAVTEALIEKEPQSGMRKDGVIRTSVTLWAILRYLAGIRWRFAARYSSSITA